MEGNFEVVGDRGGLAGVRLGGAIEQFYEAVIVELPSGLSPRMPWGITVGFSGCQKLCNVKGV